ncbi:Uncharacterised protein [uncultured archaeon]|nr:Uncharacterised protein [uncultured archaeon]
MEIETNSALYKQLTGLAGTYEVAKQLCLKNYNVSLTQKNFPSVDMFVQNPKNGKSVPIQVKAQRIANAGGFDISCKCLNIPELIVVFMAFESLKKKEMEFYIASAEEVKPKVVGEKREGISRKSILEAGWENHWDKIEQRLK